MRLAGYITIVLLATGIAGYAITVYGFFPLGVVVLPEMRATYEAHHVAIYTHVFAAVFAMALGPFQFSKTLRTKQLALHRAMGKLYLSLGVLMGGLTGLYMAAHAFGGIVAQLGFSGLAIGWLYTGLRAYTAVRVRDIAAHQRWMIRNFALTFAAVTLRIWMPASMAAGIAFESAYPVVAWLCWIPNILFAEALARRMD